MRPAYVFVSSFLLFCSASLTLAQSRTRPVFSDRSVTDIASFTIHVTKPLAHPEARLATKGQPEIKLLNGKALMKLNAEFSGQSIEAPQGTYFLLRFPASLHPAGFTISSPGVLQPAPGTYFLPRDAIGLLHAVNEGSVKISVKGFRSRSLLPRQKFESFSFNWAGYVTTKGPFTSVSASWIVPTVYGDAGDHSATWVGIDGSGDGNDTLIQVGTSQDYSSGWWGTGLFGGPDYYAWYEVLPDESHNIDHTVQPGDHMIAIISATGDPQPGVPMNWLIFLMDETQNWTFTQNVTYSGMLSTAEWIVEPPTECGIFSCSLSDLADYGSVTFDAFDFVNSLSPSLTADEAVTMVRDDQVISQASDPDGDRDGFTVNFGSIKPFPPGPLITSTSPLPNAYVGFPYNQQIFAIGATSFTWSAANLPPWLSLNPNTGFLSGNPPAPGDYQFSVVARDASDQQLSSQIQNFDLNVPTSPPSPDFSLSANPEAVHLHQTASGCTGSTTITVQPLFGFNSHVQLSASGPGVSNIHFSPASTSSTSHLTFNSSFCHSNTDEHLLSVTGTSGSLTHFATVDLIPQVIVGPCNTPQGAHLKVCNPLP
jgi:Peptidase A4 family/Putative Ig domain